MTKRAFLLGLILVPAAARPAPADPTPAQASASLVALDLRHGQRPGALAVRFESGGVTVEGQCTYDVREQTVRLNGRYRTAQAIDRQSFLSYQLYDGAGRLLLADGERFAWAPAPGGGLEAQFAIVSRIEDLPPDTRTLEVQFNYVLEHQFWYRDRFPNLEMPRVKLGGLPRADRFAILMTIIPPLLPADTRCRLPVRIDAEFRDDVPTGYRAATDALRPATRIHIDSPRVRMTGGVSSGRFWLWEPLVVPDRGPVLLRPGFVWDGVQWYTAYRDNPYRRVLMVGPLVFAVVMGLAILAVWLGWRLARRVSRDFLRWGAQGVLILVAAAVALWLVIARYEGLVILLAAMFWLGRRPVRAGIRAYFVALTYVLLLEFYWGHVAGQFTNDWTGTLFAASVAAIGLIPLGAVRRRKVAGGLSAAITLLATVTTIAMSVYFGFFHDFPSVTGLLYVNQIVHLVGSVALLTGQAQLLPLLFWIAVPLSLVGAAPAAAEG